MHDLSDAVQGICSERSGPPGLPIGGSVLAIQVHVVPRFDRRCLTFSPITRTNCGELRPAKLRYPVLIIRRYGVLRVFDYAGSLYDPEGLLIDREGLAYQVVESPLLRVTRTERRRIIQEGRRHVVSDVYYRGDPVQLSVEAVRMKVVWQVSARGHFEVPQGLPDLSRAESVAQLIAVLISTGFR